MTIIVTQEDIDKGARNSPCRCPVAIALGRCYKDVYCGFYTMTLDVLSIETPKTVSDFIAAFDSGDPVKPFSFRVG